MLRRGNPPNPQFDFGILFTTLTSLSIIFAYLTSAWIIEIAPTTGSTAVITVPAVIASAWLASVGWAYTNFRATISERRARTLNMLFDIRHSAIWTQHADRVREALIATFDNTKPVCLTEEGLKTFFEHNSVWDRTSPYVSLIYKLNHYEFLALGAKLGNLDPHLIERSQKNVIMRDYELFYCFIRRMSGAENSENKVTETGLEHLIWLVNWFYRPRIRQKSPQVDLIKNPNWYDLKK